MPVANKIFNYYNFEFPRDRNSAHAQMTQADLYLACQFNDNHKIMQQHFFFGSSTTSGSVDLNILTAPSSLEDVS
jgi:hypothetical protein